MSRPTVRHIAEQLNLSPSTVSRVLNGSPLVAEETRRRIALVAAELGYEKRRIRRHAPRSILVVALFLPRSGDIYHRLFYDPAELLAGISDGFGDVRIQVSVSVNRPRPELFTSKKSGNIDACVFGFTTPSADVRTLLEDRAIPTVLLNRESSQYNYVATDHLAGMRALVARAALRQGTTGPCYISFSPAEAVAALREKAFLEAYHEVGAWPGQPEIVRIDSVEEIDAEFLRARLEHCDTLLCFNDFVAVYAYQVALLAGFSVPKTIGIAGYDDSPVRRLTPQKIDTVSLSAYLLGKEAASWLRRTIIERETEPLQLRLPGKLVAGETLIAE